MGSIKVVLSLFDGIGCGREAIKRVNGGRRVQYYASEIDNAAISVSKKNHPDTVHLGDVKNIAYKDGVLTTKEKKINVGRVDLLLAGSPCQGFSRAGFLQGLKDPRSVLYYHFERLLEECKPRYFLLENVRMSKEMKEYITRRLNVKCRIINSKEYVAQNRVRYYWTNIPASNVEYKSSFPKTMADLIGPAYYGTWGKSRGWFAGGISEQKAKSNCITTSSWEHNFKIAEKIEGVVRTRKFTAEECERLQSLPVGYTRTAGSDHRRIRLIGNSWTVDVIAHLLQGLF